VIDAPSRLRVGVAVFGRAMAILAVLTGLFVLIVKTQGDGLCNQGENAAGGLVIVVALAVVCLPTLLVVMLRRYRDQARGPALLGWLTGLVPAVLLVMIGQGYVQSIAAGCL
jgi:hypothetical protein